MEAEFRPVDLVRIIPDPNQPRKFFDEPALMELADSVRVQGVVQPIVIRPTDEPGKYMLVVGERRYRASLLVMESEPERSTIPAVIRMLSDREALELQIIENLQRKEVHPMEEAVAFKSLNSGTDKLTTAEIAQKVSKSESYVLKRMKLTELTPEAQDLVFKGRIEYSHALKLARYDKRSQNEIVEYSYKYGGNGVLNLGGLLTGTSEKLNEAPFNTEDAELYPEAGPCGSCPFNSASNPLLFEDHADRKCYKPTCFAVKEIRTAEVKLASLPPETLVISRSYSEREEDKPLVELAKKSGRNVLFYKDFDILLKERAVELKDDPNVKEAFILIGGVGETVMVKVNAGVLKTADVEAVSSKEEIKKIAEKENRAQELDGEKIWNKVRELLEPAENKLKVFNREPLTELEMSAFAESLILNLDYSEREKQRPKTKNGVGQELLNEFARRYMFKTLIVSYGSHVKEGSNQVAFNVLKQYFPDEIQAIENAQYSKATQRMQRVNARILDIKANDKNLKKEPLKQMDIVDAILDAQAEKQTEEKTDSKALPFKNLKKKGKQAQPVEA